MNDDWMNDDWMNECLVVYIEMKVFAIIGNKNIIEHFQALTKQKIVLWASISGIYISDISLLVFCIVIKKSLFFI